jgi:1-acyl-sn-glycerol-3-phosphate acyltransferase
MPVLAAIAILLGPVVALASLPPAITGQARWRLLRLWWCVTVYLLLETFGLLLLFGLWLATGFGLAFHRGWSRRAHRWLLRTFLGIVLATARRTLNFRLEVEEPGGTARKLLNMDGPDPLIVLARHAGPGASFVLVWLLLAGYHRDPRIVLKAQLRLDPAIDVILSRLGCAFISTAADAGERSVAAIRQLAATLAPHDALLIFPEGGNFTPLRHRRAIRRLLRGGFRVQAAQAQRLRHTLPPRPGGAFAAIDAAPGAGVLIFTHTGLDELRTGADVWAALPLTQPLRMAWWPTPHAAVPRGDEQQRADWLLACWGQVDAWIDEQQLLLAL